MSDERSCPCETVKELKKKVEEHEIRLSQGNTDIALIKQDISYIRSKLESKDKFGANIVQYVIQGVLTLLLGYIAVKLGFG